MYRVGLRYEGLQDVSSEISYEIAEDIHYDDGRCSKVDVQSALGADDKSHRHREYRKEKLILNAGKAAAERYHCVQDGEDMYYPRGGKFAYYAHIFLKIDRS